jgi:branched-chain amino acid transport system permease protein
MSAAAAGSPTRADVRTMLRRFAPLVGAVLLIAVLPSLVPSYLQDVLTKVLIFGIFAMSLDILLGYTGLFSFGHAAFIGLGSYAAGMLMIRWGVTNFWAGIAAGIVLATVIGMVYGAIALRMRGSYFLLVTFALAQLLLSLAKRWHFLSPAGNGSEGIYGLSLPTMEPFGGDIGTSAFYYLCGAMLILCYLALRRFLRTPMGLTLLGVREAEPRMRALGYNTWTANFVAYVVGAAFAGLAGVLLAYHDGIASPDVFGVQVSTLVMLMVLIGGVGTLWGPVIGAVILVLAEYYASTYATERWPLILGGIFVATVMFARGGIAGVLTRLWAASGRGRAREAGDGADALAMALVVPDAEPAPDRAQRVAPAAAPAGDGASASAEPALVVDGLAKHFGGVHALDGVSLTVRKGERLAVIGTNGAGKSTLFNLISGELAPTAGTVSLFGADITHKPVHQRAQLGIGRSFQINTLFLELTVIRNVWLAIQGVQPWRWQVARPAERHTETLERAEELIRAWGLWDVRDELAKDISYGEQRRLEIVMAMASEPRLLLMDEPTAGQTLDESHALGEYLRGLPRDITAIVIAHDMDLVFSFADRIIVMHQGEIVAEGTAAEIEANPLVQENYMGATPAPEAGAEA